MKHCKFSVQISFIVLGILYSIIAHSTSSQPKYNSIIDVPQSTWDKLAAKKIYFGHYSVGRNMLEGLTMVLQEHPNIKLKIQQSKNVGHSINNPALVEGPVGKNFYPYEKLEGFKSKIETGYGQTADIAFFKFCFVDFNPETDINALFDSYKTTLEDLQKQYPDTTFAAITTPLTCYAPGLTGIEKRAKDLIKKIIGKFNEYDHSSANIFNALLTKHYAEKIPIFDLAKFESTKPDGSRVSRHINGQQRFELFPEYTTDGGHLNQLGMKIIAERFLLFLAEIADKEQ